MKKIHKPTISSGIKTVPENSKFLTDLAPYSNIFLNYLYFAPNIGFFLTDNDLIIIGANQAAAKFLNHRPQELTGKSISKYFPEIVQATTLLSSQVSGRVAAHLTEGFGLPFAISGDGIDIKPTLGLITSARDTNHLNYFILFDTSETSGNGLHLFTNQYLQTFQESDRDLIVRHDLEGCFTYINKTYCTNVGKTKEELLGTPYWKFVHPDDLPASRNASNLVQKPPYRMYFEQRFKTKKGWRWVGWEKSAIRDKDGIILGIQSVGRDITETKKGEAVLEERNIFLNSLINAIPDFIFSKDLNGRYTECNDAFVRLVGKNLKTEVTGKVDQDLFNVSEANKFRIDDKKIISSNKISKVHEIVTNFDGSKINVETSKIPLYDKRGQGVGIIGISRDITEVVRTQDRLIYELNFENLLLNISKSLINIPVVEIDGQINETLGQTGEFENADRVYIFEINHEKHEMNNTYEWCASGVCPQIQNLVDLPESIFPWWMKKLHNFDTIAISDVLSMPDEASAEKEILIMQDIKSVLVVPLIKGENLYGFIGFDSVKHAREWGENTVYLIRIVSDIISNALHRKESENKLKENQKYLNALLKSVPDIIFQINAQGRYINLFTNPGNETLLPFPREEIIKMSILEGIGAESGQKALDMIHRALDTKTVQTFQYDLKLADGFHTFEASISPYKQDEVIAAVRDISERARLEMMKTDFINRAAHELRTPLASIGLMAHLIESSSDKPELIEFFSILKQELQRETKLVDQILTAGRLENDNLQISLEQINLYNLISDICSQFLPQCRAKNIELTFDYPEKLIDSLCISSDRDALATIFTNLVDNACKFTPNDGKISLILAKEKNNCLVTVSDTGVGFPENLMPTLYDRFARGDNAIKSQVPGTGLGLFIVKSLLEEICGEISVESKMGMGTTFTVKLPFSVG